MPFWCSLPTRSLIFSWSMQAHAFLSVWCCIKRVVSHKLFIWQCEGSNDCCIVLCMEVLQKVKQYPPLLRDFIFCLCSFCLIKIQISLSLHRAQQHWIVGSLCNDRKGIYPSMLSARKDMWLFCECVCDGGREGGRERELLFLLLCDSQGGMYWRKRSSIILY